MKKMETKRLESLRSLCTQATPGPWRNISEQPHVAVVDQGGNEVADVNTWDAAGPLTQENCDFIAESRAAVPELIDEVERLQSELRGDRRTPVQGYPLGIPWSLHLRAWGAYTRKWGNQQSAERMAERGGFHVSELDEFVPGWQQEISELAELRARVEQQEKDIEGLRNQLVEKQWQQFLAQGNESNT